MKWHTVACLIIIFLAIYVAASVVWYASMPCGHPSRPIVEIGQLQTAVQSYKEKHLQYPPCLAEASVQNRKVQFMRHVQVAFSNSNYGTLPEKFDRLNDAIQNGADGGQGYNCRDELNGQIVPLDLNRLDAAESLVFWLGGFPTPVDAHFNEQFARRQLFGFHRDLDRPFFRDTEQMEKKDPLRYRTEPFYQFDETRLVDNDADGWLEYSMMPQIGDAKVPPFVYFDAETYVSSLQDEAKLGSVRYPIGGAFAKEWGQAIPYLSWFDPSRPTEATWANPESFQIITAGFDNRYSWPPDERVADRRLVVFPSGEKYQSLNGEPFRPIAMEKPEEDNYTNLSSETIGKAIEQSIEWKPSKR